MYFSTATAQIIYKDVNPDSTTETPWPIPINTKTYQLDLNNDGVNDFGIVTFTLMWRAVPYFGGSIYEYVKPLNGNKVFVDSNQYSAQLSFGDLITNSSNWFSDSSSLKKECWNNGGGFPCTTSGIWDKDSIRYLGLKIIAGANDYFGWVRLKIIINGAYHGNSQWTIYDYAYNSTPNQFILAGDTGLGFTGAISIRNNPFSILSFQKRIIVNSNNNIPLVEIITIDNTMGQEIKRTKSSNSKTEIDMSECRSGFYLVTVQTNNAIETRKIYLN